MRKINVTTERLKALRPALLGAMATIRNELTQGVSSLYQTSGNNLLVVVRFEQQEMVVVAVVGYNLKKSVNEIISLAKQNLCSSIRFHSKHPKHLEKGLYGLSPKLIEIRKKLFSNEYVFRLEI
ncbi:MAG: hypothetical protein OCD00_03075 [Colwellia sp.]